MTIEQGPNGLTDQGIEQLRAHVKEHGDVPPEYAETLVDACSQCTKPFDPTDTRWDGRARYGETPFCRSCIDRCHESTDAFHVCNICR